MKEETKRKLLSELKEEFYIATDMEEVVGLEVNFEVQENYGWDDTVVVDVELKWLNRKKVNILVAIDEKEKTTINIYEDEWEEWNSYSAYRLKNIWIELFFNALDAQNYDM